tara:strand:+ start:10901 stop:11722 length:822 start_codon:yes stop_codon:yes gene_type:complete
MHELKKIIESNFQEAQNITPKTASTDLIDAVNKVIEQLNSGKIRVAETIDNKWSVNQWVKKAILLSFKVFDNKVINTDLVQFYDKLNLKFTEKDTAYYKNNKLRVVPQAIARDGAYIGPNTVLMPSYINIGAYIDSGCMIDTWATVGSCAQIGKNCHISGGAGIGGVLEPLQANPTIIEDDCFIGARSEIVEGVIVGKGSVISMGVFIGQSTKIYNRETDNISYGVIPPYSVVVPGTLPGHNNKYSLQCAIIVKQVDQKTRSKTSINDLLRYE